MGGVLRISPYTRAILEKRDRGEALTQEEQDHLDRQRAWAVGRIGYDPAVRRAERAARPSLWARIFGGRHG